jgi:tRNA pseudouridine38-40 synthase
MTTFKITLAYDGADFVGWQRQASGTSGKSIQGLLEDALRELDQRDVAVVGAGRTDAGVHARGQVASFSLARSIDGPALVGALNARLPGDVRVLQAEIAADTFNARFDAMAKTYRYRIWNADVLDPFERRYTWHLIGALNRDAMKAAAEVIVGKHDFAAFQAAGGPARSTVREIFSSSIVPDHESRSSDDASRQKEGNARGRGTCDPLITYEVSGNGFLRHMVRAIAGTLVEIGRGRRPIDWIGEVLAGRDRSRAGPTAPAEGLVLIAVEYSSEAKLR